MPPKKKPPAKSAYYFYVEEYVQKIRERGGRIEKQLAWREAGESFENLTPRERAVYEAKAKEYKANVRGNPETKYTTSGQTFAEIDREETEKKEKQERIEREIEEKINKLQLTLSPLPIGMAGIATRTSADTHKIPYPITKDNKKEYHYENDYSKIFGKIKQFLMPGSTASEKDNKLCLPPIFTYYNKEQFHYNKDNEVLIESVLQFLCEAAAVKNNFRVLPLLKLFYEIRNACTTTEQFPKISLAEAELEKDVFAYTPKIGCDFHEQYDANMYCSLSLVRRWGFLIADHCCKFLSIPLKDGFHCPARSAKTHSLDSRPSSVNKFVSSGNYKTHLRHQSNHRPLNSANLDGQGLWRCSTDRALGLFLGVWLILLTVRGLTEGRGVEGLPGVLACYQVALPVSTGGVSSNYSFRNAQEMSAALVAGATSPSPSPHKERDSQRLPDSASNTASYFDAVAATGPPLLTSEQFPSLLGRKSAPMRGVFKEGNSIAAAGRGDSQKIAKTLGYGRGYALDTEKE
uniref:HMG box domain-containing protein n=2 Tax=Timema TaxID=61471 RepID=A0A7R9H6Y7_TIMPO|nr:unnamed protein product [Timema douglasi]CAD7410257.1 unnamed protein product [Timema poppensis]